MNTRSRPGCDSPRSSGSSVRPVIAASGVKPAPSSSVGARSVRLTNESIAGRRLRRRASGWRAARARRRRRRSPWRAGTACRCPTCTMTIVFSSSPARSSASRIRPRSPIEPLDLEVVVEEIVADFGRVRQEGRHLHDGPRRARSARLIPARTGRCGSVLPNQKQNGRRLRALLQELVEALEHAGPPGCGRARRARSGRAPALACEPDDVARLLPEIRIDRVRALAGTRQVARLPPAGDGLAGQQRRARRRARRRRANAWVNSAPSRATRSKFGVLTVRSP